MTLAVNIISPLIKFTDFFFGRRKDIQYGTFALKMKIVRMFVCPHTCVHDLALLKLPLPRASAFLPNI